MHKIPNSIAEYQKTQQFAKNRSIQSGIVIINEEEGPAEAEIPPESRPPLRKLQTGH
jgi:hypothetical protein